jgi:hypothetical protein
MLEFDSRWMKAMGKSQAAQSKRKGRKGGGLRMR